MGEMVDTNQRPVQKGETKKKKKNPGKKAALKNKGEDKGIVKKFPGPKTDAPVKKEGAPAKKESALGKKENVPGKKESAPVKSQSPARAPAVPKKQTIANAKKFLKGAWSELKKVHWPNRRELVTFTGVVLVAVTIVAILIFLVDASLSKLLGAILRK